MNREREGDVPGVGLRIERPRQVLRVIGRRARQRQGSSVRPWTATGAPPSTSAWGADITLVATSRIVQITFGAADLLQEVGTSAELIDPRTLWAPDDQTLVESAKEDFKLL